MKIPDLLQLYTNQQKTLDIANILKTDITAKIFLQGLKGSSKTLLGGAVFKSLPFGFLFLLPDKESAAYAFNDLENILEEKKASLDKKRVHFFPASYKKVYDKGNVENNHVLMRAEVLNNVLLKDSKSIIVTYPEALTEKVVTKKYLEQNTLMIDKGEDYTQDFITGLLEEYNYNIADFVYEPGQYAVRGGILDVYTFNGEKPYRVEFFGDTVESIRSFDPVSQLSTAHHDSISLFPNFQEEITEITRQSFIDYLPHNTVIWAEDISMAAEVIQNEKKKAIEHYKKQPKEEKASNPSDLLIDGNEFLNLINNLKIIEIGTRPHFNTGKKFEYNMVPQPSFNKNFNLLIKDLKANNKNNVHNIILSESNRQLERIFSVLEDILKETHDRLNLPDSMKMSLHEGFIDEEVKLACYTDHQIFERYHKYKLKDGYQSKEAITLKDFRELKPGDYITHIDHGIGKFAGLEKIEVNGKPQEAIKLIYKDNDVLYISIHSLHRISKYTGKEGTAPKVHRLGSNVWANLKKKTKKKVKDIAKDLINLYAKRKAQSGYAFSRDTYLQNELEASFFYEDTPDQLKATENIKEDMQKDYPMDRLVCGDVGYGKTEVAIRAAFKAVADSKQVAVLVPTTILALQHYKTFSDRLKDFPCTIDYINRFKSTKEQKTTIEQLNSGKLDILIGTHRLVGKDIKFSDIGLLIIDEEQKFGVSVKEKLRQLRIDVDTLTLTATPIPRTLQFSLMGARDLSIINTPPPNRYPVQTEVHVFNEEIIRNSIMKEVARGGQVFFVHNRVQNINDVAAMVQRICPEVTIAVGHGQMEGAKLEKTMYDFIEGDFDVLVATTIIESGLDIPNANTIIINEAQNYGLSDLHQLRGRVGRTNKKAYCYLISKPLAMLSQDARKRLKAIEDFSGLGSGFNIAMRDLDIRGAGNLLGAEQSGFIAEIGYETYQKILNEAISELKNTEFKDLFKEDLKKEPLVPDCQIETDLEILLPEHYVSDITERLILYKELDSIENEQALVKYAEKLRDRFGPLPQQTKELIDTIRLRWMGKEIGFEKIRLKNNRFFGYFLSDPSSPYFQSAEFAAVIEYIKHNPENCKLKETGDKLRLIMNHVKSVGTAIKILRKMFFVKEQKTN